MSPPEPNTSIQLPSERISALQILTLLLSVYVLLALFVQTVFRLEPVAEAFLERVDFWVCWVFLLDFIIRFKQAPSKRAFMKWGWVDLISSIPVIEYFRVGRLVRLIRVLRIFRALRSTKTIIGFFLRGHRRNSFAAMAAISFMLVVFSAMAILQFEANEPEANIKSPLDAFWWAYATITTVGYGDRFPISTEGRVVACILMTAGVGLFGTFTGFIASMLIEPEIQQEETEIQLLAAEIKALRQDVLALAEKLGSQK